MLAIPANGHLFKLTFISARPRVRERLRVALLRGLHNTVAAFVVLTMRVASIPVVLVPIITLFSRVERAVAAEILSRFTRCCAGLRTVF